MKSILPYIFLMTGTLFCAVALIGAVYYLKPQLLGALPKPPQSLAQKDSTGAKSPGLAAAGAPKADSTIGRSDSAAHVTPPAPTAKRDDPSHMADSIRTLMSRIDEQQKTIAGLTERKPEGPPSDSTVKAPADAGSRAKDSKSFAKMLETMPAEQAVRILNGLDDREVKAVLLGVKKRQAAKILSALDPDRAARMMRTLQ